MFGRIENEWRNGTPTDGVTVTVLCAIKTGSSIESIEGFGHYITGEGWYVMPNRCADIERVGDVLSWRDLKTKRGA